MNETFEKIWQEIDKAKSILLTLHPKADADSVGSNLGLMWALESLTPQLPSGQGKKVTVIAGDGPIPSYLKPAPGYERIVNKNIFEVNPEDYDLFLILDLSWLDRLTNKGEFKLPKNWRVINIDHHQGANLVYRQAGLPAQVSWVDTQMPAVGVMIYDLLKFRNIPLTYEISANLILAISGDTGGYKYAGVNGALFTRLADLIEYVPNYAKLIFDLENNLTPDALKFEALALSKIEVVGGLAMSLLNYGDLKASNLLKEGESENSFSANKLKAVVGWDIGAVLTESEPEIVKVSLRTRDASKYDLSKIAEALGGGGHKAAAGALIRLPLAEAKQKLIEAVRSLYPELLKLS